jgi:hypothetical protein
MAADSSSPQGKRRPKGRSLPVSAQRQCIIDFLHFAWQVPSVPVQRRMNLAAVAEARQTAAPRPGWVTLFVKAYARTCADFPELRRAYLKFPRPRFYEHPESVAGVAVERDLDGEKAVLFLQLRAPDALTLTDLDDKLRRARTMPPEAFHSYRMNRRFRWLPGPLRRLAWWVGLNVSGAKRAREFGTFGVSVYSSLGADSLHPISPLTSLLNYGPITADGSVDVRLVYDHRVTDGATIARALARLEEVLRTEIVAELRTLQEAVPKAA